MKESQFTVEPIKEDDFFWFVGNLHLFWPENAEHIRAFLDPFWFYEFGDGMLVARHERDGVVGFVLAVLAQRVSGRAYVILVAVHVDWRRKGVARLLYETAFSQLRTNNIHEVVTAIRPNNLESLLFHESVGFNYIDRGRPHIELDGRLAVVDYRGKGKHRCVLQKSI